MKSMQWILCSGIICALVACAPKSSFENQVTTSSEETAIIDGTLVTSRSTPAAKSIVYLQLLGKDKTAISYCTGTLIAPRIILTAGHCFDPKLIKGFNGFNVVFANQFANAGATQVMRKGLASSTHPLYNSLPSTPPLYDHDLAIAIFDGQAPVGYVPATIDTNLNADYSNTSVFVYGFGRLYDYVGNPSDLGRGGSGYLRRGQMKIVADYNRTPDRYFISMKSPTFLCQGDSGGPQFYNKGNVLKIIGVNSASNGVIFANGSRSCHGESQATKVAPMSPWIMNEQKKLLNRY